MKKYLTFALLSISILSACNSKQGIQDIQENTTQQEVKAQSNSGANSYIEKYLKALFDSVDKNKDGFLSRTELPNDSYFNSMDKNNDGKISMPEFAKVSKEGGIKKELFRDSLVSQVNNGLGLNVFKYSELKKTYEGFITKEQLTTIIINMIPDMTKEYSNIFYVADKNNDGKLSFSEFEDAMFGLAKSSFDNYKPIVPTPSEPNPVVSSSVTPYPNSVN